MPGPRRGYSTAVASEFKPTCSLLGRGWCGDRHLRSPWKQVHDVRAPRAGHMPVRPGVADHGPPAPVPPGQRERLVQSSVSGTAKAPEESAPKCCLSVTLVPPPHEWGRHLPVSCQESAATAPSPWSPSALAGVPAARSALMHTPCVERRHWRGFRKFPSRRHEASRNSSGQQSPEMPSPAQGFPGASCSLLLHCYQTGMPRPPAILTTFSARSSPFQASHLEGQYTKGLKALGQ